LRHSCDSVLSGIGPRVGAQQADPPGVRRDQADVNAELLREPRPRHGFIECGWQMDERQWWIAANVESERKQSLLHASRDR
jgi:hypothetical protein